MDKAKRKELRGLSMRRLLWLAHNADDGQTRRAAWKEIDRRDKKAGRRIIPLPGSFETGKSR